MRVITLYQKDICSKGETPREKVNEKRIKRRNTIRTTNEPKFLYKVERPIEKGGNYMYVFHYLSDHELTPTLDHEHTDFGYYQKDEIPEDIYYLRKYLK